MDLVSADGQGSSGDPGSNRLIVHCQSEGSADRLAFAISLHPQAIQSNCVIRSKDSITLRAALGLELNEVPIRIHEIVAALVSQPSLRLVIVFEDGQEPAFVALKDWAPPGQVVFQPASDMTARAEAVVGEMQILAGLPENAEWRKQAIRHLKFGVVDGAAQLAERPPGKIALTWWGTWPYSQVTVGDAMSVAALADGLRSRGLEFDIVHRERSWPTFRIPGFRENEVYFTEIDPSRYRVCVFVCGPLPTDWKEGRERLLAFRNAKRLAVGTTMSLPVSLELAKDVFHKFLARDGLQERWMDLALSCPWPSPNIEREPDEIALCLRGEESYYADRDGSRIATELLETAARRSGRKITHISTVSEDGTEDWQQLDAQFARPSLVLTTRLHGCLLSLRHGTPFIAVDQIVGGKKVAAINEQLQWPLAFGVESLSLSSLESAIESSFRFDNRQTLASARDTAVKSSRLTLNAALQWIEESVASQA